MLNNNGITPADIAAVTGRNDDGFGDGNGWWVLIILFALFGGWGNNWGNRNSDDSVSAEIQRGFDNRTVVSKLDGLTNGISSLGYDQMAQINAVNTNLNNAIQQKTITDLQQMNALQGQISNCCCENRQAISQLKYDLTGAINAVNQNVSDQFCQLKIERKDEKIAEQAMMIQTLQFAQSQQAQNQYLINQLRPNPMPAFMVPSPYFYPPIVDTTSQTA